MKTALLSAVLALGLSSAEAGYIQGRSMTLTAAPQAPEDLLERKITLQARRTMTLKEALDLLAGQTGSKVVVPEALQARLGAAMNGFDVKSVSLRQLLYVLLEPHGLGFESKDYGREILLKELPKPAP